MQSTFTFLNKEISNFLIRKTYIVGMYLTIRAANNAKKYTINIFLYCFMKKYPDISIH